MGEVYTVYGKKEYKFFIWKASWKATPAMLEI
jgi:hypothetical protein